MNEFTKEELKNLLYYSNHYQSCKWTSPESLNLEHKLEVMIKNYSNQECHECGRRVSFTDDE